MNGIFIPIYDGHFLYKSILGDYSSIVDLFAGFFSCSN